MQRPQSHSDSVNLKWKTEIFILNSIPGDSEIPPKVHYFLFTNINYPGGKFPRTKLFLLNNL